MLGSIEKCRYCLHHSNFAVVFNVSFFPLFHSFRQYSIEEGESETILSLAVSGVMAGSLISLTVTPFDILKTYLANSRERWSLWSGKRIYSPSWVFLARGLTLQGKCRHCLKSIAYIMILIFHHTLQPPKAFCFGPAFGLCAATFEWCS